MSDQKGKEEWYCNTCEKWLLWRKPCHQKQNFSLDYTQLSILHGITITMCISERDRSSTTSWNQECIKLTAISISDSSQTTFVQLFAEKMDELKKMDSNTLIASKHKPFRLFRQAYVCAGELRRQVLSVLTFTRHLIFLTQRPFLHNWRSRRI